MLEELIIRKTLRVPASDGPVGDGSSVARQLDAALLQVGFSASGELLEHVAGLEHGAAMDLAAGAVAAVRELVGDHVQHNAYFIGFPNQVPDTVEFWVSCLRDALARAHTGALADVTDRQLAAVLDTGWVNLLALPRYGRYQHGYHELVAAHDDLIASAGDRLTVLHLGGPLGHELRSLYLTLATSPTPLGEDDLAALRELAPRCLDGEQPEAIPVRENRAVVNAARLAEGRPLVGVDTVTDVLRVACAASHGDVTLREPTRFRPLRRAERRPPWTRSWPPTPASSPTSPRMRGVGSGSGSGCTHTSTPATGTPARCSRWRAGRKTVRSLAGRVELAFAAGDTRRDAVGGAGHAAAPV